MCLLVNSQCYNHHHCLNSRTFSSLQKETLCLLAVTLLFSQPLATTAFCLYELTYSRHSINGIIICGLLCLVSYLA